LSVGNQAPQNLKQINSGLPTRIEIPKISVDAAIEYVGLTPQGAMAVPTGPTSTAWFDLGPRPGENGSAVIAGHEGWKDGIRAVFDDLYKLRAGDEVYVKDEEGATTTFVVRDVRTYGQNGDASDVFGSSDGKAHLNLITCEGIWNAAEKSYSNRLVVFADKE
jgi:LPXTG-site transpeptidase (sortase) family protein